MKNYLLILIFTLVSINIQSQSCTEIMNYVKSKGYGTTYISYNSEAISKVTFYSIRVDYKTLYFAIVCFKQKYSYSCNEYIYQVGSNTRYNYSLDYYDSAGKAFWNNIEPYSDNLGCSPSFN